MNGHGDMDMVDMDMVDMDMVDMDMDMVDILGINKIQQKHFTLLNFIRQSSCQALCQLELASIISRLPDVGVWRKSLYYRWI